jgi:hypothetical protein
LSKVSVSGAKVTVKGTVRLARDTAAVRRRTRVALTLTTASGKTEAFSAPIDARRRFAVTKASKLTGALKLRAVARIGGRASGPTATKAIRISGGATSGGTGGGATSPSPSSGSSDPQPGGTQGADAGTPLVGLLRLDPGRQEVSGKLSGTWFRMGQNSVASNPTGAKDPKDPAGEGSGLPNGNSTAYDNQYTLLRPGADGGLRTDRFQPAPDPAFAGTVNGQPTGNALANAVIQPQAFFNVDFSIATDAVARDTNTDGSLRTGTAPLPAIVAKDGKISGQTTAWTALWNGLYFNQGAPKPDGTTPAGTTPLYGTYDASTRHFVLKWTSLIVGGPFNGYVGVWHLEGTYEPA